MCLPRVSDALAHPNLNVAVGYIKNQEVINLKRSTGGVEGTHSEHYINGSG